MNCLEQQHRISALIDGELSDKDSGEVFRHLGECGECRKFYSQLGALGNVLDRFAESAPIPSAVAGMRRPRRLGERGRGWWNQRVIIPLPAVASVACLLLVGLLALVSTLSHEHHGETVYLTKMPAVIVTAQEKTP